MAGISEINVDRWLNEINRKWNFNMHRELRIFSCLNDERQLVVQEKPRGRFVETNEKLEILLASA